MIRLNIKRFASGEILLSRVNSSSSVTFQGKIVWSSTKNDSANTSTVTAKLYARKQGSSTATSGTKWSGNITIDGTQNTYSTGNLSIKNDWVLVYTAPTKTVKHNSDGTKSITISGSVKGPSGTSLANITSSGSDTATMDRIYRQSSLSSVNVSITTTSGSTTVTVTANGTKYVSTYTDNLILSANNKTITLDSITFGTAKTLTDAQKTTLWSMFGNNRSVTISCYTTTVSGSTTIGNSNTINTVANLPEHTWTWDYSYYDNVHDYDNYKVNYGDYIRQLSSPGVTFTATSSTGDWYGVQPTYWASFGTGDNRIIYDNIESELTIPAEDTYNLSNPLELSAFYRGERGNVYGPPVNIIPYEKPSIWSPNVARVTPTSSIIAIRNLHISYYDGTGLTNLNNAASLTITYKIGESGTVTTVPQSAFVLDSTTTDEYHIRHDYYTVTFDTGGALTYQEDIYLTLQVTDLINYTNQQARTIARGIPLWYGYTVSSRSQHMVVEGILHTQNWLEVDYAANINGPIYHHDIVESDKAPRFGSVNTQEENYLPDGDLTDPYFWCGLKNGWYYLSPNTGTYEHAPFAYCWIFKNGYYSEEQSLSNFEVWLYGVNTEIVLRTKGNANTTTCVWNRLVNNAAMTINLGTDQQVTTTSATKINLNTTKASSGFGLTYSNNGIRIGAGINHVMVSGGACVSAFTGNGLRRFIIYKNSIQVARGQLYQHATYSGTYNNIPIPAQVVAVTEGDMIYMYTQSNGTNTTVYHGGLDTYLTVQVVD